MNKTAILSDDRKHRYSLDRIWDNEKPFVLFIGLNPSTANEKNDDPTIRRCMSFSKDWGYGGIRMVNLFSIRATDPKVMLNYDQPTDDNNDFYLLNSAACSGVIVCAWGNYGSHLGRDQKVKELLTGYRLMCFDITKKGQPKHPLYIKSDKKLIQYI